MKEATQKSHRSTTHLEIKLPHHAAHGRAPQETQRQGCGGEQGVRAAQHGADAKDKKQKQPEPMDSGKGERTPLKALGSRLQLKVH